ncbi:GGDEF and EAL domain-containing protein [Piscinibacter koreensis]|uniref:EAL domain-containing protein n=1 Tax=Piscinibacter koreensis TaxID=2742824 RepID=A0A7Y6TWZ9_9BURK|nr:GGDEF and EAL domain-containing protein [Schlegelella koreensis]NUZ06557.1 EAL domain-containing protein [Schlegelella koreensis]
MDHVVETTIAFDRPACLPLRREIHALRARLEHVSGDSWHCGDVERDLRAQRALLRTVVDESPDLIVMKDHEGNFLLCNKPVADFYGTTPDDMVGKHDGDYSATPEQAEFFRRNVIEIMARGETVVVFEDSTDDRTGETRHFKSIKKPFMGDDGLPRILVIAHDITDITRAQQQVQESERRLSYVLNVTGEGVWDWDLATDRLQHNQRWYELLGYEKADLSSTLADFDHCVFDQDRDAVKLAINRCLQGHGAYRHEHRMRRKDGSVIWVLERGDVVERDAEGRPLRMVGSFSDVTERRLAEAETQRLAFFDPLTGLPNRRLMLDRLEHAIGNSARTSGYGALLFIDLDNFKDLNDTKGHAAGDTLLKQVGQRLSGCLRQADTAARMGGDEFVVIVENLGADAMQAATHAESVATMVLREIGMPYDIDGATCCSTPSIGIVLFGAPDDTADELLKRADFAMYQAKSAGRNTLRFYDPAMQEAMLARAALETSLRAGLQRGEVEIYLQPVVDAERRVVGAEALARWQHPERGNVPPAEFIPLAEQCGLIHQLGGHVLQAACDQLVRWSRSPASSTLKISVNVSARQFHQADFVRQVTDIIDRSGARADLLKLELTESVLLDDVEATIVKMTELKAHGVCFSIDDFGTGYSSLAYLKRLPLDELKIDRSFVADVLTHPNDATIVRTILALAQAFSLDVVAEGVETEEQRQFLMQHGCALFQGYLFGRPVAVGQFELTGD